MEAPLIVTDKVFCLGRCKVHLAHREVTVGGQQREIEPRAFNLLAYLLEQRHRVVSKDELLDKIWPHEFVSVGSIARAVLKARQALGDDGELVFIKTVPRVGYRFVAPVSGLRHRRHHEFAPLAIELQDLRQGHELRISRGLDGMERNQLSDQLRLEEDRVFVGVGRNRKPGLLRS